MFRKPKRSAKASLRKKRPERDDDQSHDITHQKSSSDESDDANNTSQVLSTAQKKKKQKKDDENIISTQKKNSSIMHQFESSKETLSASDMATRTADYHPEEAPKKDDDDDDDEDGNKISLKTDQPRNKFLAGPLRAPTFVRTTCRFDYQPDICKDYKDTGFCGFGDTCIYLHDRGDTLTGWQLEKQWEERKKKEREEKERQMERFMKGEEQGEDDYGNDNGLEEEDGIPFACHVCRAPFDNPIVTACEHYFCEGCIMVRFKSDPTCPVCGKDTHGVFNYPQKLYAKKRKIVGKDADWKEFAEVCRKGGSTAAKE